MTEPTPCPFLRATEQDGASGRLSAANPCQGDDVDYRKRGSSWYGRLCKRSECVCCGTRYPGPVASGCCSTVCEKELDRLEASERIARRVLFTLWLSGVVMVLVAGVLLVWDSYELPLSRLTSVLGE